MPRQVVGQYQGQCAGNQPGQSIRLHVDRIAQAELDIRQKLAAIRIEDDVLAGAEERHGRREVGLHEEVGLVAHDAPPPGRQPRR